MSADPQQSTTKEFTMKYAIGYIALMYAAVKAVQFFALYILN